MVNVRRPEVSIICSEIATFFCNHKRYIAAGKHGAIFILSTLSTCSLEEVAAAAPNTIKWFQLYIYKDR